MEQNFYPQHGHQGHYNYCGTFYEKEFVINTLRGEITKDNKTIPLFITTNMGKNY